MDIYKEFAPDTAKALALMMDSEWDEAVFRQEGSRIRIELEGFSLCRCILWLLDAEGMPEGMEDCYDRELERSGEWYILKAKYYDNAGDTVRDAAIRFRDAEVEMDIYRAEAAETAPWELLAYMSREICAKSYLSEHALNHRERELLPLLGELAVLTKLAVATDESRCGGLPVLRGYFEKYGYTELLRPAERIEAVIRDEKKRRSRISALLRRLNRAKYEPLWRELYGLIGDSQRGYPARSDGIPGIGGIRARVDRTMKELGYSGTYPDYCRTGQVRGIRAEESHDEIWFVVNEKQAVFHVHCTEMYLFGELSLWFGCGTELLKDGQTPGDLHHCRFDNRGRTFCHVVVCMEPEGEMLEKTAVVAAKKAELRRLSREERKMDGDVHLLPLMLGILLLGGGLFSVLMMAGMAAISAVMFLIFGSWHDVPEAMATLPWKELLVSCWLGFGGAMALLIAWVKRG